MYDVRLSKDARAFCDLSDRVVKKKLARCFKQLESNPRQHPLIKPLKGPFAGYLRYRVDDYRVAYRIVESDRPVLVHEIVNRRDAYDCNRRRPHCGSGKASQKPARSVSVALAALRT